MVSSDSEGDTNEPIRTPCSVLGQILNDDSDDGDDDDDYASDGGHNVCFGLLFWPSRMHAHTGGVDRTAKIANGTRLSEDRHT